MRGFLIAWTFLSRIPLPAPSNVSQTEFTRSQHYYPLVGLIFGFILWLAGRFLLPYYPPLVLGALLLILELMMTGGIHLDGFMDSMDGLLSARDRERMLEIMKDSRVGAHASMSLVGLLLLKFSLLTALNPNSLILLVIMPMFARWAFMIGILGFPYARTEGLGKGYHESAVWLIFLAEGVAILAVTVWLLGLAGLIPFFAAATFVFLFSLRVSSLLGGLTGDVYGATIELTEVVFLVCAVPFFR